MSKPPRDCTSFGTDVYFVTASTWGHRSLFQTERMANLLIDTIFHYRREKKLLIHEFVIMPDHIHLLLTPAGIALERAMQLVKGGYSYRVKKELGLAWRFGNAAMWTTVFATRLITRGTLRIYDESR